MLDRASLEFYESLLSHKTPKEDGFKDNVLPLLPTISSEIKKWLEQPILVVWVLSKPPGSVVWATPGPGGLGVAVYKKYKKYLTCILLLMYRECYKTKFSRIRFVYPQSHPPK